MQTIPIAQGLMLCERVIIDLHSRNATVVNAFRGLICDRFPHLPAPFSVFALLTDGLGDCTMELQVCSLATDEVIHAQENPVRFSSPLVETQYHVRLRHLVFPEPGWYEFLLLAEGQWIAQRRLQVKEGRVES